MERNPLFTKQRASFYYEKIEYYYTNKAYGQALSEIEKNKDLLGAVLNVGKQLSLNKICVNSIVQFMFDIFEVDANTELFDEYFNKYRTTIELHAEPKTYILLHTYFTEKNKHQNLGSRDIRICQTVEDAIGEYVDEAKIITSGVKQKNSKAKSIEEDFLSSIGTPFMASSDMKEAVKIEDKLLYGSKDDFDDSPCVKLTQDEKEAFLTDASMFFDEESSSLQNHELPKASTENNSSKVDEQVMHIANELELQNQLANETASDVQLKSKAKKTASNKLSNGADSQYVKNLTINKSGGKITELEFEHTQEPLLQPKPKVKKPNPEIKNQSPEAKEPVPKIKNQAPEIRKQNKKPSSSNSKKTKKKKKSKTPAVLTAVISLALVFGVFGIFKSGIFNNPDVVPQTPAVTQSTPEANNEDINASTDITADAPSTAPDVSNPDDAIADTKSDSNADTTGTSDIAGSEYILPSDTRLLTFDDLEGMDKSEIRFAINEMYARRGWHFDNGGDYYTYFSEKSWYKPDSKLQTPTDASTEFTETENVNLATIVKYRDTLS